MAFLAGIDEAGYGPLLGPFVVGWSLFRLPALSADPWSILEPAAIRKPGRKDRRLWLDDSKRVHTGPRGRARLERTVAAFGTCAPGLPRDLPGWIQAPPAGASRWFHRAPWFRRLAGPLCPGADPDRALLDAARLRRALAAAGAGFAGFGARATPAAEWNLLNHRHSSKGDALFAVTMEVLRHVLELAGDAPLRLEIDRHGARLRYRQRLEAALAPDSVEVHGEARGGSAYTLHFGRRSVQVRFSENADREHAPVALASLAAKQTRERLMDCWNVWFAARLPGIRPTRGYARDARRWLEDARPGLGHLGLAQDVLERVR